MNGVFVKEHMKNLKKGKYILKETYPESHRDSDGRIIIENNLLYKEDVRKYGAVQAQKWVRQGKYNLTPEELEKEYKRLEEEWKYLKTLL